MDMYIAKHPIILIFEMHLKINIMLFFFFVFECNTVPHDGEGGIK